MNAAMLLLSLAAQDAVAGHPYEALATREATYERMRALLQPEVAHWGEWHLVSPFPYAAENAGELAVAHEPERELARMFAGGPGPDLDASHVGKNGVEVRWQPLGPVDNRRVELRVHDDPELDYWASCYLYTTVVADEATSIDGVFGSDDGLRFWLNGRLLVDHDVPRGLDPEAEHVRLDLEEGVNHVLVKVAQGVGDWAFQMLTRRELDGRDDALLQYLLDRDFPPSPERRFWRATTVPLPEDLALEVGGIDFLSDGTPLVCTRRGDVLRVEDAYAVPPLDARFEVFASGLHEPLGLAVRREGETEAVYCMQRPELSRLVDEDGDGRADLYETFCDSWGVSGNYHEFAFGPKFDAEGNAWVTLNVGFCGSLGKSVAPYRGWALKVTPEGEAIPVCDGLRSPNGIALWGGTAFYVDNQGDYVATNRLSELRPGSWHGHPASLRWRDDLASPDQRPPRQPPAVWFPYETMGQSAADIAVDETGGRFGPFTGQMFVGDQMQASVMRVALEEVEGHWQGACFPFLEKLDSGVNRVAFAPDGSMFVGQTDRGWGSVGRRSYGLQRVEWLGETPFEILAMRAREDGFQLVFTQPVDPASATDPASYALESYEYEYHADYGAPEIHRAELAIEAAELVDRRRVRLTVAGLRAGFVHELSAAGVRAAGEGGEAGAPLLHDKAYYTLVRIPGQAARDESAHRALPKVLFLTHSAGFQHDVVQRPDPYVLAPAEERLVEAARGSFEVLATQDCARIDAAALAELDAVVFYTTGELPIPDEARRALLDWVREGGAFVGIHCAADTLYELAPFHRMLGGTFDGHPWNQEVRVVVEDAAHPATAHLGDAFRITDEIYQYRDFDRTPLHVLLSLDPASVDLAQGGRADGDYALAWCRDWGRGRVFYTALGHSEEVWRDERFLRHLLGGLRWTLEGPSIATPAPAGATALFDGTDAALAGWTHRDGSPARWRVVDGALEVAGGSGDVVSQAELEDALLHVEFRVPALSDAAEGQQRGNSGVYVHGRYELQVLDSHGREPGLGDCGAIYGSRAADADACRPPEAWQSYDVRFRAPRFDAAGKKTADARMSVWLNGYPIHDDVALDGPTPGGLGGAEAARGPLLLQDHGHPVRYRNVWIRPLE